MNSHPLPLPTQSILLPQDFETECALLHTLMLHREDVQTWSDVPLTASLFHTPEHRTLFHHLQEIPGHVPRGVAEVMVYLRTAGLFDFKDHPMLVRGINGSLPLLEMSGYYASQLSELQQKREIALLTPKLQSATITPDERNRLQELLDNLDFNSARPGLNMAGPLLLPAEEASADAPFTGTPVLSEAALYGVTGDIVRKISPHSETHPAALLVQLLVGIGNLIGRTAYFMTERDKQYANLFAVIVGVSSHARKGTSWGHVRHLLEQLNAEWEKTRIMGGLASGEGIIAELSDDPKGESDDYSTGQTGTSASGSSNEKRLLIYEGEFGQVLRVLQREGNTLSGIIRNAWDTGNLRNMSKGAPLRASNCHISLVGHITRMELERLLSANDAANGFANRILWVYSQRVHSLPEGGDLDSVSFEGELTWLRQAIDLAQTRGRLHRSEPCRARWCELYPILTEDQPGRWGEVTSRAGAQVVRLSLIYALIDGSPTIDIEHLEAAYALWQYTNDSARWAFEAMRFSPDAQAIVTALKKSGPLTRGEINNQIFRRNRSAKQIETALTEIARYIQTKALLVEGRKRMVVSLREK